VRASLKCRAARLPRAACCGRVECFPCDGKNHCLAEVASALLCLRGTSNGSPCRSSVEESCALRRVIAVSSPQLLTLLKIYIYGYLRRRGGTRADPLRQAQHPRTLDLADPVPRRKRRPTARACRRRHSRTGSTMEPDQRGQRRQAASLRATAWRCGRRFSHSRAIAFTFRRSHG